MKKTTLLLAPLLLWPALALASGEAHGEHGGHGGAVHFGDVVANPEFWAACINFSLLVFLLVKFGGKPVGEFLSSRRAEMKDAIDEATEMKAKAQAKFDEYEQRLKTLDQELEKLRGDFARAAEEDKQRILADAEEAARRVKQETESLVDQHAQALSASLRQEVVEAAVEAAEKALREGITTADQQRLADEYRREITATSRGGAA